MKMSHGPACGKREQDSSINSQAAASQYTRLCEVHPHFALKAIFDGVGGLERGQRLERNFSKQLQRTRHRRLSQEEGLVQARKSVLVAGQEKGGMGWAAHKSNGEL
jgi:serine/threonine protein phosphatase PrpC